MWTDNLQRLYTVTEDNARFNVINARNCNDLWFYSNPVFVTVGS